MVIKKLNQIVPISHKLRRSRNCMLFPSWLCQKGQCWGPSSSEGPQKHDLTMFLEYDIWIGTFGLESESQCEEAQRTRRLTQSRSYAKGSFGMIAEKGTDLKEKRLFRPRWITIESLANVKGMNVILHGLRPVPINRWTVLPYCSRWLGICFCITLVPLLSIKPKVLNVIQYCFYFIMII
jgi:hypothetical protein